VILEGIVTTQNADGSVNISPMGPIVDDAMRRIVLRPFRTSTTYGNLIRTGVGVLHVTDDVLLFAQAAVGTPEPLPSLKAVGAMLGERDIAVVPAEIHAAQIIADACRWYAFRVAQVDESSERAKLVGEVVASGTIREFFGFNRAKHAVIEAAILATRVGISAPAEVDDQMRRLSTWVEKTGGPQEVKAFEFLKDWIANKRLGKN
jgi:uncharacterized protein